MSARAKKKARPVEATVEVTLSVRECAWLVFGLNGMLDYGPRDRDRGEVEALVIKLADAERGERGHA